MKFDTETLLPAAAQLERSDSANSSTTRHERQSSAPGRPFTASAVQNFRPLKDLADSVLTQLKALLGIREPELYCLVLQAEQDLDGTAAGQALDQDLSTSLVYNSVGPRHAVSELVLQRMAQVLRRKSNMHFGDAYVTFNAGRNVIQDHILYVRHGGELSTVGQQLLELYAQSVAISFENIKLHDDLQETQKELVYLLGEAVEARSKETGAHVKRVAICSGKLAAMLDLSQTTVNRITLASPLHDIGKVAIPDSILHKPGKLTEEEWEVMKRHAEYGRDILAKSTNPVMRMGARIAHTHHERWDGTGYPRGLKGQEIPIEGRITALVDVFDALGSRRSYKDAWRSEEIKDALLQGRGGHFDPELVDVFLTNIETFLAVRQEFPDS